MINFSFKIDKFWFTLNTVILLILVLFLYLLYYLMNLSEPKNNIKTGIATVVKYSSGTRGGISSDLLFFYNKKRYFSTSSETFIKGEKFIVEFDSLNPNKNKIRTDKPLFLSGEITKYTVGHLDKLNTKIFKSIFFTYIINGQKFTQSYKPEQGINEKYPNFKKGQKYIVRYWIENPERSIILPNQPTNLPLDYHGVIKLK